MYIVLSHTNAHILILLLCADKSCNSMDLNGLLSSHLVHPCKRIKHLQEDLKGDFSSIWLLSLNERRSDYSTTVIIENIKLLCLLRKGSPLVSASTKDYHSEYHLSMTFINMFKTVNDVSTSCCGVAHKTSYLLTTDYIPKTSYLVENLVLSHEVCDI